MDSTMIIGWLAAFFTTVALLPQVVQIIRSDNVDAVSRGMYAVLMLGVTLWLVYGLRVGSQPIILANFISMVLAFVVIVLVSFKKRAR